LFEIVGNVFRPLREIVQEDDPVEVIEAQRRAMPGSVRQHDRTVVERLDVEFGLINSGLKQVCELLDASIWLLFVL
jgi:hypothetical protein